MFTLCRDSGTYRKLFVHWNRVLHSYFCFKGSVNFLAQYIKGITYLCCSFPYNEIDDGIIICCCKCRQEFYHLSWNCLTSTHAMKPARFWSLKWHLLGKNNEKEFLESILPSRHEKQWKRVNAYLYKWLGGWMHHKMKKCVRDRIFMFPFSLLSLTTFGDGWGESESASPFIGRESGGGILNYISWIIQSCLNKMQKNLISLSLDVRRGSALFSSKQL